MAEGVTHGRSSLLSTFAEQLLRQQSAVLLSLLSHLLGAQGTGWAPICLLQGQMLLCPAPRSPSLRHGLFLPFLPLLPTQSGEKLFSLLTAACSGLLFGVLHAGPPAAWLNM